MRPTNPQQDERSIAMNDPERLLREYLLAFQDPQKAARAFAEYVAHPTAASTGRKVHHLIMGLVVVENGQITRLREALNTVASAQALLPGGAADLPAPDTEISSF